MFVEEKIEIVKVSNKLFGQIISGIFICLGTFFYFYHNFNFGLILISLSVLIFTISFISPNLLSPLNSIFVFFGSKINFLVTFLIISILFVFVFSLFGLLIRIFKKDLIKQNLSNSEDTYWVKRTSKLQSMDRQF